jgi:hypothetical protein
MTFRAAIVPITRSIIAMICVQTICGCANEIRSNELNWSDPKLEAIKPAIRALARDSVNTENSFSGKPLQLSYCVSIEPRISDGFAEMGEDVTDQMGLGVPCNLSLTCAKETLASAQTAVIDEAILSADLKLRTSTELLIWRGNRWESASDYYLGLLAKENPRLANELRNDLTAIRTARQKIPESEPNR